MTKNGAFTNAICNIIISIPGNEYDKYQGEEHDALLTELKESADLETIKLANRLFV